jgi:hypothetical protein
MTTLESEEELIKALKDIFSSEKTKQMIRALIAHSEGSS